MPGDAQAAQLILHRPGGGLGALLRPLVAHGGIQHAPVVQHPGDMHNAPGPLAGAQGQVMVLAAVVVRAQSPQGGHELPLHGHQVADIVPRPQGIRGEVPLEMGIEEGCPVGGALVLVGIDHVRAVLRGPQHPVGRVGGEQVVMVHQGDPVQAGHGQGRVGVPGNAQVFPAQLHPQAGVPPGHVPQGLPGILPGAGAVVKAGLPAGGGLRQQGVGQLLEQVRRRIVRGNQEGKPVGKARLPLAAALLRARLGLRQPAGIGRVRLGPGRGMLPALRPGAQPARQVMGAAGQGGQALLPHVIDHLGTDLGQLHGCVRLLTRQGRRGACAPPAAGPGPAVPGQSRAGRHRHRR